jgi:anti-sigma-K factor RskA
MEQTHTAFQDNLAAYALGALDPEETAALEAHLQTCESCRAELADYQSVSTGLMAALPPRQPRGSVRRALQKQVAGQSSQKRAGFSWPLGQAVFGALMVALIALNVFTVYQLYTLKQEQAEQDAQRASEQTAISMLAYPSTQTLAFEDSGVSGSLLVDKQRNLVAVFAWNLPNPPAGKAYQMWLVDPKGDRTSGGFLVPEANYPFVLTVVHPTQPLTNFTGFGVTLEPAGGSPAPTGPRIFRVSF